MRKQVISLEQTMSFVPYFIPAIIIILLQVLIFDKQVLDLSSIIWIAIVVPVAVLIFQIGNNLLTNHRASTAQKSLQVKIAKLAQELKKVSDPASKIEDLVFFFEKTTAFIDDLTKDEWAVTTESLRRFTENVGRGEWNKTPIDGTTKIHHIYIQPTGHYDEDFRYRFLEDLIADPGPKTNQGGHARRPMDDKEFYFLVFVKPFMQNNYRFLLDIQEGMK